jgi:VWFA-related protein
MRYRILRPLGLLAVGFFVGALSAVAQTTPSSAGSSPDTALMVTARLVVLDVVVLDRNGHPVSNVDRSKFHIFEDKAPQTIRNFDPPNGHEMPAGSATESVVNSSADLPKIGNAPVNVLVFDEVNTPFLHLAYARQMMEKYLRAQPEVLPIPTLFVAAGSTKIAVLHDYTQSRADLLESIKKHTGDLDFTQVMSSLNGGSGGADNGMVKTLGALSQIAASLRGVPGRKNVIWVGTGYGKSLDLNNMSTVDHDQVVAAIQQVTDRMLVARVTLYTIDPEGPVRSDPGTADTVDPTQVGSPSNQVGTYGDNMAFESFATATGGRVITGRNDIDVQLAQVSAEGTEYYTLAYVPTSTNDAARPYRRIRVTVDDPALRVITRTGYFGGDAPVSAVALERKAKQVADVKFDLLNAARTTLVYNGLHMTAKPSKTGFTLLVNANDLRFVEQNDGSRVAEVTVVAVCYNAKGKESSQHVAELKQQLEATDVIQPDSQVGFVFPMIVPAFTDRVRFVMRDANTAILGTTNAKP